MSALFIYGWCNFRNRRGRQIRTNAIEVEKEIDMEYYILGIETQKLIDETKKIISRNIKYRLYSQSS